MIKETIICSIIIILIFIGNSITQNYTNDSVESLISNLEELKNDIKRESSKEQLEEKNNILKDNWDKRNNKLAYYLEHNELEKVENNITSLISFIEEEEYSEAINEIDKCAFILKHIKEKYELKVKNIF